MAGVEKMLGSGGCVGMTQGDAGERGRGGVMGDVYVASGVHV